MTTPRELPLAGQPVRVRRDAVANADRILCAARRVVDRDGVENLTMDRLAAEAGVGKGTVFRAFGNRAGLFAALTDDSERQFQQAHLSGPPPLGPGAPPLERLLAYGAGRLRLVGVQGSLILAQVPAAKFDVPARKVSAMHIRMLLRQCGVEDNVDVCTEALLGALDPDLVRYLATERGLSDAELRAGWQALARAVVGTGGVSES
ncbi:TetR/AcrR family transcriptional regulator [Flexivirga alba]|uniref:TetR/AcrR family transcriptional regulator n=1 Tax=Flexivirga alba TaxID=702742 RepID=A0ABW2AFH0_9MICO